MSQFLFRTVLLCVVVICVCALYPAAAFPYGKSSAVTELTPATFANFVNTHKPVVVLFYTPLCGHCKSFHPKFERFAESVKGTMRVGAIDADRHPSIAQQYGVRGFPTVKYWKMGPKSMASPQDYQGERTPAALQNFMVSDITAAGVKQLSTMEELKQASREAPLHKVGVLFSAKEKVPPMLSVMSLSPKLKEIPLAFVGGCALDKGVAQQLKLAQLPTLGVLRYTPPAGDGAGEGSYELLPYADKDIAYEAVAGFFVKACDEGDGQLRRQRWEGAADEQLFTKSPEEPVKIEVLSQGHI